MPNSRTSQRAEQNLSQAGNEQLPQVLHVGRSRTPSEGSAQDDSENEDLNVTPSTCYLQMHSESFNVRSLSQNAFSVVFQTPMCAASLVIRMGCGITGEAVGRRSRYIKTKDGVRSMYEPLSPTSHVILPQRAQ